MTGAREPEAGAVALSVSETAALCLRAARGAGRDWAEAEELGFAAAWLARHGLPGCDLACALLHPAPPAWPGAEQKGPRGATATCPIHAGLSLMDRAALPDGPAAMPIILRDLTAPGLILPFVTQAARLAGVAMRLETAGATIAVHVTADGQIGPGAALVALCRLPGADLHLSACADAAPATRDMAPCHRRTATEAASLGRLNALALRATVPASETSRAGAGAESGDND